MKFFLGIVPPSPIYDHIIHIQKQFGDNRTEPHITLRPPVLLTKQQDWIEAVESVANNFAPLHIKLEGTGYFGDRVLFIKTESEQLMELEKELVAGIKPFEVENNVKQEAFHPHLTLGRSNVGFTKESLQQMQKLADELLKEPVYFEAKSLRVYHQPLVNERYKIYRDISF